MAWYSFILDILGYLGILFLDWIKTIFIIPFKSTDMLWLLVPVWIAWAFAEFFQEKRGTSMGNAISNAVIILWGSIDCARQTTYFIARHATIGSGEIFIRFLLIALIFAYGTIIIWLGIKANSLIKYIGRIREVTYVFIMFVPIFYGAVPLSINHIVAALIFFPLFYYVIELLDYIIPDPKVIGADSGKSSHMIASVPNHQAYYGRDDSHTNKTPFPSYGRKF